ncbi:MAG: 4-(cytidine 5'-diphospho)-2-C-methyl-D-erythritol kinase [Oscillospiraceae bacterium]
MDNKIYLKTPAKINLSLDIIGKLENGYHSIKTVMQTIDLFDFITIEKINTRGISISSTKDFVPTDESNLVYKCAMAFFKLANITNFSIHIHIEKHIPAQAGLAGGSGNGAGVIVGLNALFNTNFTLDILCSIGGKIGADIPFCIQGGTVLAEGIGEIITPIHPLCNCFILTVKPQQGICTKQAFDGMDLSPIRKHPYTNLLIDSLILDDLTGIAKNMYNVLEEVAPLDEIKKIKNTMLTYGALGSIMSGSGSAVFGIFKDKTTAIQCMKKLSIEFDTIFLNKPVNYGATILSINPSL